MMPGGFGNFGVATQPFGPPTIVPGVSPTTAVASWLIDSATQRYVLDANGNPLGMDGTDQRVYYAVCGADTRVDIITPQVMNQARAALRAALAPLVSDGSIAGLAVTVEDNGKATVTKTVTYTNAGTNRNVSLRVR